MKKVLVYPCGTEIGLEIFRSLKYSPKYEIYGGSSSYDHGRFVYEKHIDELPFISDDSSETDIIEFNNAIVKYGFDFIYPAMDGVLTVFSKYRELLSPIVVAPEYSSTCITRSKQNTYNMFRNLLPIPTVYDNMNIVENYPVFIKPDVGQGAVGTAKVENKDVLEDFITEKENLLILEYLPGKEYTIDCFSNKNGKLVYCSGRGRNRIKNGISVNACFIENKLFKEYAEIINKEIHPRGGWFFQLKEDKYGNLKLLEIASRIAGTSGINRCAGVNLPLLSLDDFNSIEIDSVIKNKFNIEMDRALGNWYKIKLEYDTVYVDYDDTIVEKGKLNTQLLMFLYQCINNNKRIILISKHLGDLDKELKKYKIYDIFDEIRHLSKEDKKVDYVKKSDKFIFIDDSYGERGAMYDMYKCAVFDPHAIECLLEG